MIHPERITGLNSNPTRDGDYVLYWMQAAQRAEYNHALEYAIDQANNLELPLVVMFGVTDSYPEANLRHYQFMFEGLQNVQNQLQKRGIIFVIKKQSPEKAAVKMSIKAALLVTDAGHTNIQRKWRKYAADNVKCLMQQVETNLIVPPAEVTDKENFSAGTFRPRINRQIDKYLAKVKHKKPKHPSINMKFDSFDISDITKALSRLDLDTTVRPSQKFKGGTAEAKKRLKNFIKNKLDNYDTDRNNPSLDATSNMSPYLHFGQVSPLYIALEVMRTNSKGRDAFLEELIVRRELAFNFTHYNRDYDKYKCLHFWAINTLNVHKKDKRQYIYTRSQFENAKTHDPYWNAAQKEMILTGKMHGYMRMYWGKKILEWTKTPQQAFKIALYLNNKYELDGRDPNGFAGVAWCFGKHDRAWARRPVFGKVRYMNAAGLKRKFDADKYVEKIAQLERDLS